MLASNRFWRGLVFPLTESVNTFSDIWVQKDMIMKPSMFARCSSLPNGPMKPPAFFIPLLLSGYTALAQSLQSRNRDGLISAVAGWSMTYYSSRWEPVCGTITAVSEWQDFGSDCVNAIARYRNDTTSTLSFYDAAGVKLIGAGVGLGRAVCMCFAMSTNDAAAYDLCWPFDPIGQFLVGRAIYGSYRPGAAKSLPHCGDIDVAAVQSEWTRTAVMPQETGPVETISRPPTTVEVTREVTHTLTPTMINLTITSSAVVTGSDGHPTTEDRSYTTTAAVINFQPAPEEGLSTGNKIALGVGLGLGLPSLLVAIGAWAYSGTRRNPNRLHDPPPRY